MPALTIQTVGYTGADVSFAAISGVDTAQASNRAFLWVKNASGVSTTVNISVPGQTFLQNNPDVAVTVPAGQERMMGPLNPEISDASGTILFITSPTTSVTAAVVQIPAPPPDLP